MESNHQLYFAIKEGFQDPFFAMHSGENQSRRGHFATYLVKGGKWDC